MKTPSTMLFSLFVLFSTGCGDTDVPELNEERYTITCVIHNEAIENCYKETYLGIIKVPIQQYLNEEYP